MLHDSSYDDDVSYVSIIFFFLTSHIIHYACLYMMCPALSDVLPPLLYRPSLPCILLPQMYPAYICTPSSHRCKGKGGNDSKDADDKSSKDDDSDDGNSDRDRDHNRHGRKRQDDDDDDDRHNRRAAYK